MTLVSGDITSGKMTFGRLDRLPMYYNFIRHGPILVEHCQMTDCDSQEGASKRICSAVDSSLTYVT